ncbi:MAG: hypothetical protein JO225_14685, partial [Candidatus Eremiobacteraeota bacterium]|nr:hypothetical protein [Candidatus Eremiobacteraeota bacterium]
MKTRALAVAAFLVLVACGGGGGGGGSTGVPPTAPPTNTPITGQSANLTITIPSGGTATSSALRSPQFVSPNTKSITIQIVSVNGSAPTQ